MLGHLVHMRDDIEVTQFYFAPKSDGWMKRAWRALFSKKLQTRH